MVPNRRATLALLWLAGTTAGCLLFTDRINTAPVVTMIPPERIVARKEAVFHAEYRDPDGDVVTLTWRHAQGLCKEVLAGGWQGASAEEGNRMRLTAEPRKPFCVQAVARDSEGAESVTPPYDGRPINQPPVAGLNVSPTVPAGSNHPLYAMVRLDGTASTDDDGDPLQFTWKVRHRQSDLEVKRLPCDRSERPETHCFVADRSGEYEAVVEVSDGEMSHTAAVSINVGPDRPPCLEATDPPVEVRMLVMGVADRRLFEVRRVSDDGHPFPGTTRDGLKFVWSVARKAPVSSPWSRALGHDTATFEVGAGLPRFEDARPGSVYRVRVEPRDPEREARPGADLVGCSEKDEELCKEPPSCVRWVTWTVVFQ